MRPIAFVFPLLLALPSLAQDPAANWIADARTGCKVWNPSPRAGEAIAYSGECSNGMAHGQGTLQWYLNAVQTSSYAGEFNNGRKSGRGVIVFSNGNRYEGDFKDDLFDGRGVFKFANGDRYEGEVSHHQRNGWGIATLANGDRYEGRYKDNRPNGFGTAVIGGETFSGTWKSGCLVQGDRLVRMGVTRKECGLD